MKWNQLTQCQKDAARGVYSEVTAAYIRWLAKDLVSVRSETQKQFEQFRQMFSKECRHPRTASIAAELLAGLEPFLEFAQNVPAISVNSFTNIWERFHIAIRKAIEAQNLDQQDLDPVDQYLELLATALHSGRAYVTDLSTNGRPNESATSWGWEEMTKLVPKKNVQGETPNTNATPEGEQVDGREESGKEEARDIADSDEVEYEERTSYRPKGERIGWVFGDSVYLLPKASLAVVQRLAKDYGTPLPLSERSLGKRLHEKALLVKRDEERRKYTTRINVKGGRPNVLHLASSSVIMAPWYRAEELNSRPKEFRLKDILDA